MEMTRRNGSKRTLCWERLAVYAILSLDVVAYALALSSSSPSATRQCHAQEPVSLLAGDWAKAKTELRNPDCCVVSVSGLDSHLRILQDQWTHGPANTDLRARVRVGKTQGTQTYDDCLRVRHAVTPLPQSDKHEKSTDSLEIDPCAAALQELARGVASLADGPFAEICDDVFLRVVCASSYKARDPMFHTDKAPLRGYVTLRGPGTDFMTRTCTPVEYLTLRCLGTLPPGGDLTKSLRRADELEFIVMKGDHYTSDPPSSSSVSPTKESAAPPTTKATASNNFFWQINVWKRTFACVHRSPPANNVEIGGRRVIVSLDLADGDDDREWYEENKKREWRSGMTQRKSKLVA